MNPDIKAENEELSDAASSTTCKSQRPRRNAVKAADFNSGLLWTEEKELKRALYASLQDSRKVKSESECDPCEMVGMVQRSSGRKRNNDTYQNGTQSCENPKRAKVHAQRKFAQGSNPTSPSVTPVKIKNSVSPVVELISARKPKTEDFLTFLCFRGTSVLPPTLGYFNSAPSGNDLLCDGQYQPPTNGDVQRQKQIPKSLASRGGPRVAPKPPPAKVVKSKLTPKKAVTLLSKGGTSSYESSPSDTDEDACSRPEKTKPVIFDITKKKMICVEDSNLWSNRKGVLAQLDFSVSENSGVPVRQAAHVLKQKYRQQRLAKHKEALTNASKKTISSAPVPSKKVAPVVSGSRSEGNLRSNVDGARRPERGGVLTRLQEQAKSNGARVTGTRDHRSKVVQGDCKQTGGKSSDKKASTISAAEHRAKCVEARRRLGTATSGRSAPSAEVVIGEDRKPVTRHAAAQLLKTATTASRLADSRLCGHRRPADRSASVGVRTAPLFPVARFTKETVAGSKRVVKTKERAGAASECSKEVACILPISHPPMDHSYVTKCAEVDSWNTDSAANPTVPLPPKFVRRTRSNVASDFSSDDDEPLVKKGSKLTTKISNDRPLERLVSLAAKKTLSSSTPIKGDTPWSGNTRRGDSPAVPDENILRPAGTANVGRPATRQTREVTNAVVYLEPLDEKFSQKQPAEIRHPAVFAKRRVQPSSCLAPPRLQQAGSKRVTVGHSAAMKDMSRRDAKVVVVPVDVTKKKGRRSASEIILDTSTISTSSASSSTTTGSSSVPTSPVAATPSSLRSAAAGGGNINKTAQKVGEMSAAALERTSAVKTRDFMKKLNEAQFKLAQAQGEKGNGAQQHHPPRGTSGQVSAKACHVKTGAQSNRLALPPVAASTTKSNGRGLVGSQGTAPSTHNKGAPPSATAVHHSQHAKPCFEKDRAGFVATRPPPKSIANVGNKGKIAKFGPGEPKKVSAKSKNGHRLKGVSKGATMETKAFSGVGNAAKPKAKRGPPIRKNVIRETDRKSSRTKLFGSTNQRLPDGRLAGTTRNKDKQSTLKRRLSSSSSSSSLSSTTSSSSSTSSDSSTGTFTVRLAPAISRLGKAAAGSVVAPPLASGGISTSTSGSTSTSSESTSSESSTTSAEDAPSKPESTTISVRQNVASTSVAVQVNLINDISDLDEDEFWEPGMIEGGETMEDFFVGMDRVLTPTLCKGYSPTTAATSNRSGGRSSWEQESPPTPLVLKMAANRGGETTPNSKHHQQQRSTPGSDKPDTSHPLEPRVGGKCRTTPTRQLLPPKSVGSTPATPSPLTIKDSSLPCGRKAKSYLTSDDDSDNPPASCGLTTEVKDAPVFHPTDEEFQDPLEYIEKIRSEAEKFGVCKIIPPASFRPECKVADDMRFTAHNQYVHKVFNRSGPSVKEMDVLRKHLEVQGVDFSSPPLIGGMELDLPRLLRTVQQLGGLQEVIEKKKWKKVADIMKIAKSAQDRVTKLYDAYCRYLLSYDTLSKEEKLKLEQNVENSNPLATDQKQEECSECVTKGRSMSLSGFYRIARNTMAMWFRGGPKPKEVEQEYWRQVTQRKHHICVNAGNIDSSTYGYGFACNKNSPFARHPWNLKVLTNNQRSILRCMGPVMGVTIPTLHVGMLFTTGCWYRDPHCLPWIEYLHTGASKIWYGVPASQSCKFRDAMGKIVPYCCTNNPIWVPSDTAMVPPNVLVENGVSLCRLVQNSGQYVVVFPRVFTSTLCCGYSISESVYFATPDWLEIAPIAFKEISDSCEPSVFSLKRLLVGIATDGGVGVDILKQIYPLLKEVREREVTLRKQLCDLGLNELEHIPLSEVKDTKKRASRGPNEQEHECDVCRENCYISMVINTQNDVSYCLRHAVEHLLKRKKDIKFCKLLFLYSEVQLNELVQKTWEQILAQTDKKKVAKKPTKKMLEK